MLPPSGSSCQSAPEVDVSVVIIIFPVWCSGLVTVEGRSLGAPWMVLCNHEVTCWRSHNMVSQRNTSPCCVNYMHVEIGTHLNTYSELNKVIFVSWNLCFLIPPRLWQQKPVVFSHLTNKITHKIRCFYFSGYLKSHQKSFTIKQTIPINSFSGHFPFFVSFIESIPVDGARAIIFCVHSPMFLSKFILSGEAALSRRGLF